MEPSGIGTVNQTPDSAFLRPDWTRAERWSDGEPISCLCLLLTGLYRVGFYRQCAAVIYRSRGEKDECRGWEVGRTREVMSWQTEEEAEQPQGRCIWTLPLFHENIE